MKIIVSKEYTNTPGGRFEAEGKFSGEDFRETLLLPQYEEAVKKGEKLVIDLDGGYGYATSFLEEAFGGLARKLKTKDILKHLVIISLDEPSLINKIAGYINEADISEHYEK